MSFHNKFSNKKVIVTGHTGFKGSWLTAWLQLLGAKVFGLALDIPSKPSHFKVANLANGMTDLRVDLKDKDLIKKKFLQIQPDFVFHLAAQPLVSVAYQNPVVTWQTNVFGTLHVLEALRGLKNSCAAVIITSDKCYNNLEIKRGYAETDILGGKDPYSASKAAAEILIRSHVMSFFSKENDRIRIASARAGNVIGGGDWSHDRVIPDCVRSWSLNKSVKIRNPNSTRPWQHVLEAISGYLCLAALLYDKPKLHGEPFNFGPYEKKDHSVLELVKEMSIHWPNVKWNDASKDNQQFHESQLLKLNCKKAYKSLNWKAVLNFNEMVEFVAVWYQSYYKKNKDIKKLTYDQIIKYQNIASKRKLKWASPI